MKVRQVFLIGAVAAIAVLVQGQHASATIVDLEAAQQANASLVNQWTFAGGSTADQEGSLNLNQVDGATPGSIDYTGDRATFSNNNGSDTSGSALQTNGAVPLTDAMTIEFVVTPLAGAGGEDHIISGASGAGPTRFYFTQNGTSLIMRAGNGGNATILSSGSFVAGNDYYVAMTLVHDDPGDTWTLNAFVGNLTAGDALVTQTVTDSVTPVISTPLFFDNLDFGRNGANQFQRWSGSLDAVAIYGAELSGSEIATNYGAAIAAIPEPSSFILMGMSVAGLGLVGRRRQLRK